MRLCNWFAVRNDGTKSWCFMLHGHAGEHRVLVTESPMSGSSDE